MADEIDWSETTWEGSRRRQHKEWLALSFRDKVKALEEMEALAAKLAQAKEAPR